MKRQLTVSQITCIQTLLTKHGLRDEKESIVESFSGGRTTSLRELRITEAQMLIGHLKSLEPSNARAERMRNKILSIAHEMGWYTSPTSPRAERKLDMRRVNNWCLKYGYLHKLLDEYTYEELPKLVTQFEEVYKDMLRKV